MRHPFAFALAVLAILAVAAGIQHAPIFDTGFWSADDFHQLNILAKAEATNTLSFRPALAGGYMANPLLGLEFHSFGLAARPYIVINLIAHVANAFLAYLLVNTLLHDRRGAFLAALLFVLSVGSYGKNLTFAMGISSLVYAMAVLLGTLFYVLNEKRNAGRPIGSWAFAAYVIFFGSLFMRGGTFSLLASFVFYNIFFARERGRPVLHTNLVICLALAAASLLWRILHGDTPPAAVDTGAFLKNLPGYLILMVFPLHQSELLSTAPGWVRAVYAVAPYIRVVVGMSILSYSLFGLIFGNRTIRFYIAWMYVMVVPFAVFRYPSDWLNLRFLYLVSLGFCVLLTTGTLYAFKLLSHRRGRRLLPFAIPIVYVLLSAALIRQLDRKNEALAAAPATQEWRAQIAAQLQR